MLSDWFLLSPQMWAARMRNYLKIPTTYQMAIVIGEAVYKEQELRRIEHRNTIEALSRLADEVSKIQGTVTMLALWQAKHDVEPLERRDRGTHEADTCRK